MTLTSNKYFQKIMLIDDNLCAKVHGVTWQNQGWEQRYVIALKSYYYYYYYYLKKKKIYYYYYYY